MLFNKLTFKTLNGSISRFILLINIFNNKKKKEIVKSFFKPELGPSIKANIFFFF